jgi:hypothetical protein
MKHCRCTAGWHLAVSHFHCDRAQLSHQPLGTLAGPLSGQGPNVQHSAAGCCTQALRCKHLVSVCAQSGVMMMIMARLLFGRPRVWCFSGKWQGAQRGLCIWLLQTLHTLDVIIRILKPGGCRFVWESKDQSKAAGSFLLQAYDSHATQKSENSFYRRNMATRLACAPHPIPRADQDR